MSLLSLVIPAYNEAESLSLLFKNIGATLHTHGYTAEVIFIDGGSTDATTAVLDRLASRSQLPVHVIAFKRNRGKAEALRAGFQKATGDIVMTMDADLQDDPTEIPKLLAALENGKYDVVSGWKYPLKGPLEKRGFSFIFNRVTAMLTGVKLHDMNCGFKAYRAEVVKALNLYGDLHRYIPILAQAAGFSAGEVKFKHHPRRLARSKYGFKCIPKGFIDLLTVLFLTKYRNRPMHFFAGIGSLFAGAGLGVLLLAGILAFSKTGAPFVSHCLADGFSILTGIVLRAIGLLGELFITLRNE